MMVAVGFIPRTGSLGSIRVAARRLKTWDFVWDHAWISTVAPRRGIVEGATDRALKRPATISHRSAMGDVPPKSTRMIQVSLSRSRRHDGSRGIHPTDGVVRIYSRRGATLENVGCRFRPSMDFKRRAATGDFRGGDRPGVETPGYHQSSLRDGGCAA